MKKQDEKASALVVQKHQLNQTEDKLSQINTNISNIDDEQKINNKQLDGMLLDMEKLLNSKDKIVYKESNNLPTVDKSDSKIEYISKLDKIDIDENSTWEEYMNSIKEYAFMQNINLEEDPFEKLMTTSQRMELEKRIQEDFVYKNAQCDKYDYMIAGTCGVISGLIDILFVGAPGDSKLGDIADEQANKITEKFAEFLGWDKDKAAEKGSNSTASAIGFLEKKFKINYDQATTHATGGAVKNLSLKNHHLKSLGHSPDIIGLFFSVLNQFTNTSSFISNGQIITIETGEFELQGHNFIAKIFCGFANWFGHIMSDWAGSSGTVGQGGRGTGVPIPFYNLFQLMDFGEFGQHRQTFATITTKVFEQGYDARHGAAMAIPVLINELLIRFMYTMKAHFYHKKDWKDSLPSADVYEVRRMLLVGHGVLCIIDGADAYVRSSSGAEIVTLLSRTNLIAWTRFGHLALKEVYVWHKSGHINIEEVDKYLDEEFEAMLSK